MSSDNLQHKTLSGIIWGFLEKFSTQLVTFIVGIILARLLSPSDYGLIAMVTVFVTISGVIVDSGFSNALIRKKDRTDLDYSTVFVINVGLSVLMALLLCLSAPLIAGYYKEPILIKILYLNALYVFLGSFISVQSTKLYADMNFKARSTINVVNSVVQGVIAVGMAFAGYGVWSLIVPKIFTVFSAAALYWHFQHWFPGIRFSKSSAKNLFSFGSKLLASTLLNVVYQNLYPIVIGKKFSASDLGFYSKGSAFANLPATTFTNVIGSVAFPVLSSIQDNDERLASSYRRMLRLSAYILFPLMIGLAVLARPLIVVLITAKWERCVILLQILCFDLMWYPIHALNLNLLQVKGRSDLFLKLEVIKKIIGISVLAITLNFGIVWMCFGSVFCSLVALFINTYYTGKLLQLTFWKQMKDLIPSLLASLSMGACVYLIILPISNDYVQLIVGILGGICIYYVTSKLFRMKELGYLLDLVKNNIIHRK
jgi:teichuronic acid exporter